MCGETSEAEAIREREAARVVLLDDEDRVLLIEGHDPARPAHGWYWFTIGGGLDRGETAIEAAIRETREETGLTLTREQLGPIIHEDAVEFVFEQETIRQRQAFFIVRVAPFEPDRAGWLSHETRTQRGMRWWSLSELRATAATVYPDDLADLVERWLPGFESPESTARPERSSM
ncbi:NUDIX domain-containing protein [Microbacterium oryzae]|uniref:NUDIX hydrolase n=1 Tax=Microbacterium oryzae TaxID=743009 RepID=UPI0025B24280|nr:NUDIX domain-containing protein [Microbacterium oryzae]MDN3311007.1 NUDIX domain-containing protein [Microbacterium oryzae]